MQEEVQVMQIVRIPPRGKLVVQIGPQRLEALSEVTQPALRQRLLAAIGELVTFAGGYQVLVDAGMAPAVLPPKSSEEEAAELEERRAAFLSSLERQGQRRVESLVPEMERDASPKAPIDPMKVNIASQINEILDQLLIAEPRWQAHAVRVRASDTGLIIETGGKTYTNPNEIPDIEAKALIKTALRQWDKK